MNELFIYGPSFCVLITTICFELFNEIFVKKYNFYYDYIKVDL